MRSLIMLVSAALAGLAIVAVAGAGSSSHATFTVVERATTDTVTDTGEKGDSAGDILTFANSVYDSANTKKVGSDNGYCVRTVVGTSWECFWTTFLSGGQITVEGPFLDAGPSTLAITGGTGKYSRARGSMDLEARNDQGTEFDFTFHVES
jgi:Allene oxide cyclase